jgi:peptidyl-prolyl cis-trans isomerase C
VGKPVVRVNGAVLTDRDLLREMLAIFPYAGQHNAGFPKAMEADIRRGALKMIVFEELVYQEAQRRKMTVPQATLSRAVVDFQKHFPSDQQFHEFLNKELNGSQAFLRLKIRRSLLIEEILKTEVTDKASLSAAQLREYYDKNPNRFKTADSLSIQTISFLPTDKATPGQALQVRKRAEDGLRQAKATKTYEEFGALAEKISEDDFRVMMGDRKSVERSQLPPEVQQATRAIKEGQVSDLIQIGQAYCIVRLNARTPAGTQGFETVKDSLREELQRTKTEKLRAGLDRRLRMNAKIEEL